MAFLIAIGTNVHRQAGPRERECRHHAGDAIQPAGLVLGFQMAADQQMRAAALVAAEHVADAVDRRIEADGRHFPHQPAPAVHIVPAEGGAMHAGAERAELAQRIEVLQEARGIDRQDLSPWIGMAAACRVIDLRSTVMDFRFVVVTFWPCQGAGFCQAILGGPRRVPFGRRTPLIPIR